MISTSPISPQYTISVKCHPPDKQNVYPYWKTRFSLIDSTTKVPIVQSPVQTTPPFGLNKPGNIFKLLHPFIAGITPGFRKHDLDHGVTGNAGITAFQEFTTFVIQSVLNYGPTESERLPKTIGEMVNLLKGRTSLPQTSYKTASENITLQRNPVITFYPMYGDQLPAARKAVIQYFETHPASLQRLQKETATIQSAAKEGQTFEAALSPEASRDLYEINKLLISLNLKTQWEKRPLHTFGEPHTPEDLMKPVPYWVSVRDLNHLVVGGFKESINVIRFSLGIANRILHPEKPSNLPLDELQIVSAQQNSRLY